MPGSAGQASGARRQGQNSRSRQRQQQQQRGTDAPAGPSTLRPEALTWQQQDMMQQQPQEQQLPQQRRRQRQPRPGSQQSRRNSDAEPSQAGDQQQQQAGEYGQQDGGAAIAGAALQQQQLEQGGGPALGPPRQQRRRQQPEQLPQPPQRQQQGQGQGRQVPDGGYGYGYGYPPPHWQHKQQVQHYYGGGWEPDGGYGYPPGISVAAPEPQLPGRRQRQQRPPPPPEQQQRHRESRPDRPPPPQPPQPLEGLHQRPAASNGGKEGAGEADQAQQQQHQHQHQHQQDGDAAESPHCLVCCSPMTEVAVGACNHKEVCGMCTLRLRICYGRRDCPLCKAELREVVIAPWRGDGPPDFDWYMARPEYLARSAKWDKATVGVLADRWQRGGRLSSRLMHELQRRTALACTLCDRAAQRPFARPEQLLRHVQEEHDHRLCNLCLQEGHLFALEMRPYPGFDALQQHLEDAHPRCDFCRRRFYDSDGLWKHMQQAHYSCHVCPPPAGVFAYFNTARDLVQHMRNEHHMCEEPECTDCFVAFPTAEELRRHHLERHSARMPRWDPSRARPLQIDIQYVGDPSAAVRQAGPARGEGRRGSGGARGGRGRGPAAGGFQDVRVLDAGGGGSGRGAAAGGAAAAASARPEYALEGEGGFLILDDDLGMLPSHTAFPTAAGGQGAAAHWEPAAGGSWAARRQPPPPRSGGEEFPSLAAAAAVAAAAGVGAGPERESGCQAAGRRPPPLVKKTVKCPCGRRASHFVVEEGQEVPTLACDAVCELEGRRSQLAGAFGVDHPERHVSYFDRHRVPVFSGQLLAAAQKHPKAVEALEKAFAAFLGDASAKRHSLPSMPREQRAVAHELAEQYGLASSSYGQEPHRYVELFKTDASGVPTKLLSRVAPAIPPDEVAAMVREGSGHPIRLTDVALSVDLHYYLRRWEGAYKLEWEQGDAVVVRFERREDMEGALNQLGGGIRGLFRVDRTYRPKSAITAAGPGAVGGGVGAAGWGASSGAASAGPNDSWTVVAASAPRPQQQPALPPQQQQEEDAGSGGNTSALPSGWTVIGSKKAPRVARPVAAAGGGGSSVGAGSAGSGAASTGSAGPGAGSLA